MSVGPAPFVKHACRHDEHDDHVQLDVLEVSEPPPFAFQSAKRLQRWLEEDQLTDFIVSESTLIVNASLPNTQYQGLDRHDVVHVYRKFLEP